MTLAVQLALSVHVHDVDFDQPVRHPAPDAKIEPAPETSLYQPFEKKRKYCAAKHCANKYIRCLYLMSIKYIWQGKHSHYSDHFMST